MKIRINGETRHVECRTLHELLEYLGHPPRTVATAVNQEFVPVSEREHYSLTDSDSVDIIAPMSGG